MTDAMLIAAAHALAAHSPTLRDQTDALLPPIHALPGLAPEIAFAVGREARQSGKAPAEGSDDEFRRWVAAAQWKPVYPAASVA